MCVDGDQDELEEGLAASQHSAIVFRPIRAGGQPGRHFAAYEKRTKPVKRQSSGYGGKGPKRQARDTDGNNS